ncbi:MAG: TetR/AcrR family transcriptional regulator [Solirubrobacteraceae bacterium]|nr:TetR/AcrR family transcriptional regulator [Patulibacter sp.]
MPTQVQRTASARRRLIAAATTLVAEQGVGNTSVAAIGEKAGMSRGAVNFHFGSKDDLLTAVAEEVTADFEARAYQRVVPEGLSVEDALRHLTTAHREDIESNVDRFRIFAMLFFEAMGPSPHLHEHFARLHRRMRSRMVETLQPLVDSGQVRDDIDLASFSLFVISAFRGLAFQFLLDPEHVDLAAGYDEIASAVIARLIP